MAGLEKAVLVNTLTREEVPVQFNPEEYTVSRESNFAQLPVIGSSSPVLQFVHGNAQTLEMELFLDTLERHDWPGGGNGERDVRKLVKRIVGFMDIDAGLHAPPPLIFSWADFAFGCVLGRANQRFTMFAPDGTPVRARLQVTFTEHREAQQEAKEVKRQTADYSALRTVSAGETLVSIAWDVYRDPALWKAIARRNRISDPRRVPVGTRLLVPRLPFRDPETGAVYAS